MQRSTRPRDKRVPNARRLRREMTDAERKLWRYLRSLPLEQSHFRRQATVGPFFADFACHQCKLIIEVDGGQHNEPQRAQADASRTVYLESNGYRVLRFWNNDVLTNIDGVSEVILAAITEQQSAPTPDPSPPQAGGGEKAAPTLPLQGRVKTANNTPFTITSACPERAGGCTVVFPNRGAHADII
jgi:very-short-patch-repair endonuclease